MDMRLQQLEELCSKCHARHAARLSTLEAAAAAAEQALTSQAQQLKELQQPKEGPGSNMCTSGVDQASAAVADPTLLDDLCQRMDQLSQGAREMQAEVPDVSTLHVSAWLCLHDRPLLYPPKASICSGVLIAALVCHARNAESLVLFHDHAGYQLG